VSRRFCYALDLNDDPALIAEYERHHRAENAWPEITESLTAAGIVGLEIHRTGDRLFMIMDVDDRFDPQAKALADAADPKVQEWETLMWRFQKPLPGAEPGEKWRAMDLIYDLRAVLALADQSKA
jgi:L-rhamnose mutarotase